MKIAIQTWGSNGDIRPMLALGHGLVRRGHGVTLAVSSIDNRSYASDATELGMDYRQIPGHVDLDLTDFAQRTFRMHGLQWLRALLDAAFFPYEDLLFETSLELAKNHDLLIGHHFLYPLKLAARLQNKPHVSVTLCPAAIPTPHQPPLHCPDWGQWGNRFFWWLAHRLFDWYLKPLTRLWSTHGQPPIRQVFEDLLRSDQLDLLAVDPFFCEAWPIQRPHRLCGFFNLEEDTQQWTLPTSLEEFLNEGETPIYCTFGSLQQAVPEWAMELFIAATRQAECRAIIQTSSQQYPTDSRLEHCYFIGRHPHQPLFERCRAVVHHGGAGTTQAATRAGCPSVVVPFMDEQLFWGEQLHRLGLSPPPLLAKRAHADRLAQRIRAVLSNPRYLRHAQAARQRIVERNGVQEAVFLIEGLGS